jgi:hypothetical protein
MKKNYLLMLSFFLLSSALISPCSGSEFISDYDFDQGKMTVQNDRIYLISSFDNVDHISCYDFQGRRLWNVPFHAKITSWRALDNVILVFSKARSGENTFLTCLEAWTGAMLWQRP